MTDAPELSSSVPERRTASRPRPWLPFLSLAAQVAVVGVGAQALDSSDLYQSTDSWGFVFAFAILAIFYASWPLLATLVCGVVATVTRGETVERRAALVGAWVAGGFGAIGIVTGTVAMATGDHAADQAFGVVLAAASVLPLLLLVRMVVPRQGSPAHP
ncbi:hypothetical protein [Nocardioides sp. GXQ0305]|uniref:hypothetical protein n=1 Tax=Nocardioides sp. GXQ0305 TaxID=3423912 RepID=UPI003D7DF35A